MQKEYSSYRKRYRIVKDTYALPVCRVRQYVIESRDRINAFYHIKRVWIALNVGYAALASLVILFGSAIIILQRFTESSEPSYCYKRTDHVFKSSAEAEKKVNELIVMDNEREDEFWKSQDTNLNK